MKELTTAWKDLDTGGPPMILPGDEKFLSPTTTVGAQDFSESEQILGGGNDFHLSLVPTPYIGPINSASIYILLFNPGFSTLDLYV